jgi:uncharacterized damage-inducible protein DinB
VEGQAARDYPKAQNERKMKPSNLARPFLAQARHLLAEVYLPRIAACLRELSAEQIWWRPNPASNSVGNLVLHLEGNVRQWIVSGLGGTPDRRLRDLEFSEAGPILPRTLLARLRRAVTDAGRVMGKLDDEALSKTYSIQGFRVTGLRAVFHVAEHFSHHTGQVILLTKLLAGKDLKFTHLPQKREKRRKTQSLPPI